MHLFRGPAARRNERYPRTSRSVLSGTSPSARVSVKGRNPPTPAVARVVGCLVLLTLKPIGAARPRCSFLTKSARRPELGPLMRTYHEPIYTSLVRPEPR